MEKTIILSKEDIDNRLGFSVPNGTQPDWDLNGFNTIPEWESIEQYTGNEPIHFRLAEDFEYFPISELKDKKHIYLIRVYDPVYFVKTINGFAGISTDVLTDVYEGRAKIVIDATAEPMFHDITLYELYKVDHWMREWKLPVNSVILATGNLLSGEISEADCLYVKGVGVSTFEDWLPHSDTLDKEPIQFLPDDKPLFLFYSRMPRKHRLYTAYRLWLSGLLDKGKISLVREYNEGYPTLKQEEEEKFNEFMSGPDLTLDFSNSHDINLAFSIHRPHYESTFLSIIGETDFHANCIFFSEKTFKPIALGHPFMISGNKHSLKKLKEFGYKTFSQWIDESYDNLGSYQERSKAIAKELKRISKLPLDTLISIRKEMEEVVLHNRNLYFKRIAGHHSDIYPSLPGIIRDEYNNL